MIKVHGLDAEFGFMMSRAIGKRQSAESSPQEPQSGIRLSARGVLRDLQIGHAGAKKTSALIVAFGNPNRTVRRQKRRHANPGEGPQVPFPIHLQVHAGHTVRQGDRHGFLAHQLDRTTETMRLAHDTAGSADARWEDRRHG